MEGVKIAQKTKPKEKMASKLQRIAERRHSENKSDPMALHIMAFLQEFNKESQRAAKDSERGLDSERPVLSASLHEEGNEE